jgi:hypothetical protein
MTDGLESVVIQKLKEGTFYAELNVRSEQGIKKIDARPSDAIALALRAQVPIKVSEDVFEEASIPMPTITNVQEASEPTLADNVNEITRSAELRFDLEHDLREAVSREDYEEAALIRDRLKALSISEMRS